MSLIIAVYNAVTGTDDLHSTTITAKLEDIWTLMFTKVLLRQYTTGCFVSTLGYDVASIGNTGLFISP